MDERPDPARRPGDAPSGDVLGWLHRLARIDLNPTHRPPTWMRLVVASVVALAGSLGADDGLVRLATTVFASTAHFAHFRFSDYATLTVIGVLVACAGWAVVTVACRTPRWLFVRLAIVVTLVLWLPDVWILVRGEPGRAVGTLMVMHLAIAVVTYQALIRIAPVRPGNPEATGRTGHLGRPAAAMDRIPPRPMARSDFSPLHPSNPGPGTPERPRRASGPPDVLTDPTAFLAELLRKGGSSGSRPTPGDPDPPRAGIRRAWDLMAALVAVEFAIGVATIMVVRLGRGNGLVPQSGAAVFAAHAAIGLVLGIGAMTLVVLPAPGKMARTGAVIGLAGVAVAGVGGAIQVFHSLRLLGMALMMVGTVAAEIGYLLPALEAFGESERRRVGVPPGRPQATDG